MLDWSVLDILVCAGLVHVELVSAGLFSAGLVHAGLAVGRFDWSLQVQQLERQMRSIISEMLLFSSDFFNTQQMTRRNGLMSSMR